ncbi:hypothetical protein ACE41H_15950 [Paenibacillus enshidis]|uniref:Uncharacterized protein n=1 Tax=Paenibacillus enshidis TaxID=1458439 RepID=A0ABV5AVP1_9BACL
MAVLRDCENQNRYIEYEFISHIPGDYEGSQLLLKYFTDSSLIREQKIGWTNLTINNFIEMLKTFPNEEYDGYFSHFEKHLEIKWMHEEQTDLYLVILMDIGTLFTLKVSKEDVNIFGAQFEDELNNFL